MLGGRVVYNNAVKGLIVVVAIKSRRLLLSPAPSNNTVLWFWNEFSNKSWPTRRIECVRSCFSIIIILLLSNSINSWCAHALVRSVYVCSFSKLNAPRNKRRSSGCEQRRCSFSKQFYGVKVLLCAGSAIWARLNWSWMNGASLLAASAHTQECAWNYTQSARRAF